MRVLAVITARGGSKRLPFKNIRLLGGRPLIVWSIDVVRGLAGIVDTLVSTDDDTIAQVARDAGALVPWLRPAVLSSDEASSVDVVLHALNWYEAHNGGVDGVLMLQPTSPFRSRRSVEQGLSLFRDLQRPVLGVSPAASHPMWCFRIESGTVRPFVPGGLTLRSQDLPPAYVVNGGFYLAPPQRLRLEQSWFTADAVPLVMEGVEEAIDIDTEVDWAFAEAWLAAQCRNS